MKVKKAQPARFQVGDWVSFPYPVEPVVAQILADSGPLGIGGRHLYRIRLDLTWAEPDMFEVAEDELKRVPLPDKVALLKYFKEGGLVAMLQTNLIRADKDPQVWLSYTREGHLTHTLLRYRGVLGGVTVPYFALHETRVFAGKQEQVIDFLAGFGLTRHEAEEVIAAVGTAP